MKPQHHGPAPFVALIAGVSVSLWLVVSAGVQTATAHPMRLPEPPTNASTAASNAARMPSPGAELSVDVR